MKKADLIHESTQIARAGFSLTPLQHKIWLDIKRNATVQALLKGHHVQNSDGTIESVTERELDEAARQVYVFKLNDYLTDTSNNRIFVAESFLDLAKKTFIMRGKKSFVAINFFEKCYCDDTDRGIISLKMTRSFYEAIASIQGIGITTIDYEVARNLPIYAARIYENIVRWQNKKLPPFPVDILREITGTREYDNDGKILKDKYPMISHFEKNVLEASKQILDDPKYNCPYSFNYARVYEGKKVVAYQFSVYYRPENNVNEATALKRRLDHAERHDRADMLKHPIRQKLLDCGFNNQTIINNAFDFFAAQTVLPDFPALLSEFHGKSRNPDIENPQGYIVNCIRTELRNAGYVKVDTGEWVKQLTDYETPKPSAMAYHDLQISKIIQELDLKYD